MMQIFGVQWDSAAGVFPPRARLRALYANGAFATRPVRQRRGVVWIDVLASAPGVAQWLDVERGDASPADVGPWLDARRKLAGDYATAGIYCDRSTLPDVQRAAEGRPHDLWVATLDGTADVTVPDPEHGRLVAVQDLPASMTGIDADASIVVDEAYWKAHALP